MYNNATWTGAEVLALYRMHNEVRINSDYCLENVIKKGKKRLKKTPSKCAVF